MSRGKKKEEPVPQAPVESKPEESLGEKIKHGLEAAVEAVVGHKSEDVKSEDFEAEKSEAEALKSAADEQKLKQKLKASESSIEDHPKFSKFKKGE